MRSISSSFYKGGEGIPERVSELLKDTQLSSPAALESKLNHGTVGENSTPLRSWLPSCVQRVRNVTWSQKLQSVAIPKFQSPHSLLGIMKSSSCCSLIRVGSRPSASARRSKKDLGTRQNWLCIPVLLPRGSVVLAKSHPRAAPQFPDGGVLRALP